MGGHKAGAWVTGANELYQPLLDTLFTGVWRFIILLKEFADRLHRLQFKELNTKETLIGHRLT